jgi:hypothetical protein
MTNLELNTEGWKRFKKNFSRNVWVKKVDE